MTAHEDFGVPPVSLKAQEHSAEELWNRAVSSLKSVLQRLGEGKIYEFANMDAAVVKKYQNARKKDPDSPAPYSPQVLEAFEAMEQEGYYPKESNRVKYPQYLLITEPAEAP